MYLDLRELIPHGASSELKPWGGYIVHPDPQLLKPGERRDTAVVIDPDLLGKGVKPGTTVEFALTGYIRGKVIGGANFRITKRTP